LFESVDKNGDGYVTVEELREFMESNTPDEESYLIAKKYTSDADKLNKDGKLDEQGIVV